VFVNWPAGGEGGEWWVMVKRRCAVRYLPCPIDRGVQATMAESGGDGGECSRAVVWVSMELYLCTCTYSTFSSIGVWPGFLVMQRACLCILCMYVCM
jgi:hypothetical protein